MHRMWALAAIVLAASGLAAGQEGSFIVLNKRDWLLPIAWQHAWPHMIVKGMPLEEARQELVLHGVLKSQSIDRDWEMLSSPRPTSSPLECEWYLYEMPDGRRIRVGATGYHWTSDAGSPRSALHRVQSLHIEDPGNPAKSWPDTTTLDRPGFAPSPFSLQISMVDVGIDPAQYFAVLHHAAPLTANSHWMETDAIDLDDFPPPHHPATIWWPGTWRLRSYRMRCIRTGMLKLEVEPLLEAYLWGLRPYTSGVMLKYDNEKRLDRYPMRNGAVLILEWDETPPGLPTLKKIRADFPHQLIHHALPTGPPRWHSVGFPIEDPDQMQTVVDLSQFDPSRSPLSGTAWERLFDPARSE